MSERLATILGGRAAGNYKGNVDEATARRWVSQAQVARLATVDRVGRIDLVPMCFALLEGDILVSAVDHKPKVSKRLKRLDNVAWHPEVTVLVDHYDDEWEHLWWIRMRGRGVEITDPDDVSIALRALRRKYPQYLRQPPTGPVLAIEITAWSGWAASPDRHSRPA